MQGALATQQSEIKQKLAALATENAALCAKVDAMACFEALRLAAASGLVNFPTGTRERLAADRVYYVDAAAGSDSNNGLSSAAAFSAIQKAINSVVGLDMSISNVTIQLADGTYQGAVLVNGPWLGSGSVTLQGNTAAPANVVISTGAANAITVQNGGYLAVKHLKLTNIGNFLLHAQNGGFISFENLVFGACGSQQIRCSDNGTIRACGNYTISGGSAYHISAVGASVARIQGRTITLTGTPHFSVAFANAQLCSALLFDGCNFVGSATGPRYNAIPNGAFHTCTGIPPNQDYFPGDASESCRVGANTGNAYFGVLQLPDGNHPQRVH